MPLISVSQKQLCWYRWEDLVLPVANNVQSIVCSCMKNESSQLKSRVSCFAYSSSFLVFTVIEWRNRTEIS